MSFTPTIGGQWIGIIKLLGAFALIGWSTTGCSSTSKMVHEGASGDFPNHSLTSILDRLPVFPESLNRVKLEALVAVSSPEMDGQFTAIVESQRHDTLFARIKFPLGIEGARVLVTKDSAFTYDRISNVVYRGGSENMKEIIPGSLVGLDMVDQAFGFYQPDRRTGWILKSDDSRYYLHAPDESIRYTIDPTLWRIEQIQSRDAAGLVTEQRWFLDFREMDGVLLPSRMILVQSTLETRLSVALRSLSKNPGVFHFNLDVRADTRWKDLLP